MITAIQGNLIEMKFALNHIVRPQASYHQLLNMAKNLDCVGVEFRNDFAGQLLFGGDEPSKVKNAVLKSGVEMLALAEVKMFNRWSDEKAKEAEALMKVAVAAGSSVVSLIPAIDGVALGKEERQDILRHALRELKPMLEHYNLVGFVEPLGFPISSVRYKSEAINAIDAVGADRFKIVHDTFHHALAGGGEIFPDHTGIVHISGVVDREPAIENLEDAHRVLVDADDRLGNIQQIQQFLDALWKGVFSFEPFAAEIHNLDDVEPALKASIEFIKSQLNFN